MRLLSTGIDASLTAKSALHCADVSRFCCGLVGVLSQVANVPQRHNVARGLQRNSLRVWHRRHGPPSLKRARRVISS